MELKSEASIFPSPRPILRWAGGKQQLLPILLPKTPKKFNRYIEPFFGGGDAMTIRLKPDLVYIDPPYYSPYSDNEYVRRYHFVDGKI